VSREWIELGATAPTELTEARLQLHHAAQIVAAPGTTLLPAEPDDGQTGLGWLPSHAALAGRELPLPISLRAAIGLTDLRLLLLDETGRRVASADLAGRTLEYGYGWMRDELVRAGVRRAADGLSRPAYELPDHEVARGAPFADHTGGPFDELARWYGNAHLVLETLAARDGDAAEVRCWPHHFDIATLLTVERGTDGAATKTVGVGLSPGDGSYAEPYWYVTPWPYPRRTELPPPAGGGHWHVEGFTAAVLPGTGLTEVRGDNQRARLEEFLDSAVASSRELLGH